MRFGKLCLLVLLLVLLAACAHNPPGPPNDVFGADAVTKSTRMLVAWIAEGTPMPGYDLAFCPEQDRARLKECRVICPYLPAGTALSSSPIGQARLRGVQGASLRKERCARGGAGAEEAAGRQGYSRAEGAQPQPGGVQDLHLRERGRQDPGEVDGISAALPQVDSFGLHEILQGQSCEVVFRMISAALPPKSLPDFGDELLDLGDAALEDEVAVVRFALGDLAGNGRDHDLPHLLQGRRSGRGPSRASCRPPPGACWPRARRPVPSCRGPCRRRTSAHSPRASAPSCRRRCSSPVARLSAG